MCKYNSLTTLHYFYTFVPAFFVESSMDFVKSQYTLHWSFSCRYNIKCKLSNFLLILILLVMSTLFFIYPYLFGNRPCYLPLERFLLSVSAPYCTQRPIKPIFIHTKQILQSKITFPIKSHKLCIRTRNHISWNHIRYHDINWIYFSSWIKSTGDWLENLLFSFFLYIIRV